MTDYKEQQRTATLARVKTLQHVINAGEQLGLWKPVASPWGTPTTADPDMVHCLTWQSVEDSEGRRFTLRNSDGKVTLTVASRAEGEKHDTGIRVFPKECLETFASIVPEASASADREPGTIAKSLHKRVMLDPRAQELATKVAERFALHKQLRTKLLENVKRMEALGWAIPQHRGLNGSEYYEARMYRSGVDIRVTAQGAVYVERATFDLDDMPTIAPLFR